jgi:hypothetical protein
MSLDDLLITIIIMGIGLSVAYLKAEYKLHVCRRTAERRSGVVLNELPASSARIEQNGIPVHVCIARAPTQSQPFQTMRFLARNSRQEREHRVT